MYPNTQGICWSTKPNLLDHLLKPSTHRMLNKVSLKPQHCTPHASLPTLIETASSMPLKRWQ